MIRVFKALGHTRKGIDLSLTWAVPLVWLILIPLLATWPASFWYSLDSVIVTDEFYQGDRILDIDRTVHRNFSGRWRVEEQIKYATGYATVEVCFGRSRYRTDKSPPQPITLTWWKGERCRFEAGFKELPAGTYRLCTWATIKPTWFPEKEVERCSPDFTR